MPSESYVPPVFLVDPASGEPWPRQGDLYRDVEYIEGITEEDNGTIISISKLIFPLALVLGQDCDLLSDGAMRTLDLPPGRRRPSNSGAVLLTVLMVPLYNAESFFAGDHCSQITESLFLGEATSPSLAPIMSAQIGVKSREPIMKGENARFQYMHFGTSSPFVDCVIDFKHYFSVTAEYLVSQRTQCLGRVRSVFRESVSQRFSYYLARIGLPDEQQP